MHSVNFLGTLKTMQTRDLIIRKPLSYTKIKPSCFEGSGYNYGFAIADMDKSNSYYAVYRKLKDKLERCAPRCRVHMNPNTVKVIDICEHLVDGDIFTIYIRDIVTYYKFNHGTKCVAIGIDANKPEKTGFWFIKFDQKRQLTAFCSYLDWLVDMDSQMSNEDYSETSIGSEKPALIELKITNPPTKYHSARPSEYRRMRFL